MGRTDLPGENIFALSRAIGEMCDFAELRDLIGICYGESIFAISYEQQPRHQIARECVDWALKCGILENFVAIVLRAKSEDQRFAAFKALVEQVIPAALAAPPSVLSGVDTVISGLDQLNAHLNKDHVRQQLDKSRQNLADVRQRINLLAVYKGLHDNLHRLQITQTRTLLQAAASAARDPADLEVVQAHIDNVFHTVSAAQTLVANADAIAVIAGFDLSWINEMRAVALRCQDGLDTAQTGAVRNAVKRIAGIADSQSTLLNKGIFNAATKLPLADLAGALSAIGETDRDIEPSLRPAIAAIGDLQRSLMGRVATHNRLQAAQENLSLLAGCLDNPNDQILSEMTDLWPETRTAVLTVSSYGLEPATNAIDIYGDKVDGILLQVEQAQNQPDFDPRTAISVKSLQQALASFQRKANVQFFEIDCKLKADFDSIFRISERLGMTLGGLQ
ncbi:hypothetical protein ACMDCR_02210 [Labrys okinawensis]|uniref:hypothetical protein n=1 Tax=Labrys okinawensis TaxID=346911 RepID=UPI0039BCBB95